jgi:hypothetical protein
MINRRGLVRTLATVCAIAALGEPTFVQAGLAGLSGVPNLATKKLSLVVISSSPGQVPREDTEGGDLSRGFAASAPAANTFLNLVIGTTRQTQTLTNGQQTPSILQGNLVENPSLRQAGKRVALIIESSTMLAMKLNTTPDVSRLQRTLSALNYRVVTV